MSEPHTSELNSGISLIYIIMYHMSYIQCTCARATFEHYTCASTTRAHLDAFIVESSVPNSSVVLLLAVNMNTRPNTSRRVPKPPQHREDKVRHMKEQERAQRVAEAVEQ